MDSLTLLAAIRARGIALYTNGERIGVRPKDRLTPDLRAGLKAHKAAVLALLTAPRAMLTGWADCHACHRLFFGVAGQARLCVVCEAARNGKPVPGTRPQHHPPTEREHQAA